MHHCTNCHFIAKVLSIHRSLFNGVFPVPGGSWRRPDGSWGCPDGSWRFLTAFSMTAWRRKIWLGKRLSVDSGVPETTLLDPLFFLMHINDNPIVYVVWRPWSWKCLSWSPDRSWDQNMWFWFYSWSWCWIAWSWSSSQLCFLVHFCLSLVFYCGHGKFVTYWLNGVKNYLLSTYSVKVCLKMQCLMFCC